MDINNAFWYICPNSPYALSSTSSMPSSPLHILYLNFFWKKKKTTQSPISTACWNDWSFWLALVQVLCRSLPLLGVHGYHGYHGQVMSRRQCVTVFLLSVFSSVVLPELHAGQNTCYSPIAEEKNDLTHSPFIMKCWIVNPASSISFCKQRT